MSRRRRPFSGAIPDGAREYWRAFIDPGGSDSVQFRRYWRVKDTPAGFWVTSGPGQPMHWTTGAAKNRFVDETQEAAVESLLIRAMYRVAHKEQELWYAKRDLRAARRFARDAYPDLVADLIVEDEIDG